MKIALRKACKEMPAAVHFLYPFTVVRQRIPASPMGASPRLRLALGAALVAGGNTRKQIPTVPTPGGEMPQTLPEIVGRASSTTVGTSCWMASKPSYPVEV
jgi:hypothetical protein